jgi:lipopolysaccharide export system permease protein
VSKLLTKFDRLIVRRLLVSYVILVGALIVFFVVLHYVEFVDDFIDRGATMTEVFTVYYPNYVPEMVRLLSPLALFLATLFLTGRLAQKMELAALQTSGVSLYRLMYPYVLVGISVVSIMFVFNGWVVPGANRVRIRFEHQYLKQQQTVSEYNNIHRQNSPGSVITVSFFDRQSLTAHTVTLQQFENGERLAERIDARSMQWIDSTRVWRLRGPVIRKFRGDGSVSISDAVQMDTVLNLLPRNMARTDGDVESMTISEAADYLDILERAGASNLGLPRVSYFGKFAYPFSNLILVLLAVPLAAVRRRKGQAMVLGIGLFLAFVYLALMKLLEPFAYSGQLSPALIAWLPHTLFFVTALVVLSQARK